MKSLFDLPRATAGLNSRQGKILCEEGLEASHHTAILTTCDRRHRVLTATIGHRTVCGGYRVQAVIITAPEIIRFVLAVRYITSVSKMKRKRHRLLTDFEFNRDSFVYIHFPVLMITCKSSA